MSKLFVTITLTKQQLAAAKRLLLWNAWQDGDIPGPQPVYKTAISRALKDIDMLAAAVLCAIKKGGAK